MKAFRNVKRKELKSQKPAGISIGEKFKKIRAYIKQTNRSLNTKYNLRIKRSRTRAEERSKGHKGLQARRKKHHLQMGLVEIRLDRALQATEGDETSLLRQDYLKIIA